MVISNRFSIQTNCINTVFIKMYELHYLTSFFYFFIVNAMRKCDANGDADFKNWFLSISQAHAIDDNLKN